MKRIRAGEAQVGDIVAEPIVNEQGRTLLPRGARLSAAVLSRLEGWGVGELCIEGDDAGAMPEPAPADGGASDLLAALEHRFEAWAGDEVMDRIRAVARRHLSGARPQA